MKGRIGGEEGLSRFVTHLQEVNRFLRSSVFDRPAKSVTRVQWLILRSLQTSGACTIGQLAERLDVRPSTMSQMIDRLEKNGLTVRGNHAADARIKTVDLTPDGELLLAEMQDLWKTALAGPFMALNDQEQMQLLQLMEKLAEHIPKKEE